MILNGSIKTTEEKAKAIRSDLEKLVTKAKKGESSKRNLTSHLKPFEIEKMINEIAPAFKNRNGGYTRIIRTGRRFNDDASLVLMQWTEEIVKIDKPKAEKTKKTSSKSKKVIPAKTAQKSSSSSKVTKRSPSAKAKEKK